MILQMPQPIAAITPTFRTLTVVWNIIFEAHVVCFQTTDCKFISAL
jgi:hypothetical protein